MKNILNLLSKTAEASQLKTPDTGFIPYSCYYNPDTILTKNGQLLQTIRIIGFSFDLSKDDSETFRESINDAIRTSLPGINFAVWLHTVRTRKNLDPSSKFDNIFAEKVRLSWNKKNYWNDKFSNELYITILIDAPSISCNPITNMGNFLRSFSFNAMKSFHSDKLEQNCKLLTATTTKILEKLKKFNAQKLGIVKTEKDVYSEHLGLFGQLMHLVERDYPLPAKDLSEYMASDYVAFGNNYLQVQSKKHKAFAEILTFKEMQKLPTSSLDKLLQLPLSFIITEVVEFNNKKAIQDEIKHHNYLLDISGDRQLKEALQLDELLPKENFSKTEFGKQQISIMFKNSNPDKLAADTLRFTDQMHKLGIITIAEDLNLEDVFWSQLPGNFNFLRRKIPISVKALGNMINLNDFYPGRLTNKWGNALTVFRTLDANPYYFNFHAGDKGNSVIVGSDGAGKTTCLNFLLVQALKYKPNIVYFSDRNSRIFTDSIGLQSYCFEQGNPQNLALNPFSMEESATTIEFLNDFIISLANSNGYSPKASELDVLKELVNYNFKLDNTQRKLANIVTALAKSAKAEECIGLINALKPYHSDGELAHLFDNNSEIPINFSAISFDIESIRKKSRHAILPLVKYLNFKMAKQLDNKPTIYAFDNADELLNDALSTKYICDFIGKLEQNNGIFLASFNKSIYKLNEDISKSFFAKIQTSILLASEFTFTETIYLPHINKKMKQAIRDMKILNRHFMVIQDNFNVVAELNLTGLTDILKTLSANEEQIASFQKIKSEKGQLLEDWLPAYMDA